MHIILLTIYTNCLLQRLVTTDGELPLFFCNFDGTSGNLVHCGGIKSNAYNGF
jgi:hypothetical protein